MDQIWVTILTAAGTCAASLLVTFLFNKVAGLPQQIKKQKQADKEKWESVQKSIESLDERITKVEEAVSHYPEYRAQSIEMQKQLKEADIGILDVCKAIKEDVVANREMLDSRLKSLERREKNALREKILDLYRKFTDNVLNPMLAWTDMEHHAFFELVKDYESLGGNDYVHKVIIPAMNELDMVYMEHLEDVKALYESRQSKHISSCKNNKKSK